LDGADKRKHSRVKAKLVMRYRNADALVEEYTRNISKGGLFVLTDNPYPLGSDIELTIELPDASGEIEAKARVMHVVPRDESDPSSRPGMGLELTDIPAEGREIIEGYVARQLKKDGASSSLDRPDQPRKRSKLRVRFLDEQALKDEYLQNISHGGIFIKTRHPKQLNEILDLNLTHPKTGENLHVEGEVVRIVSEEESRRTGQPPGMGIRFVDVDEELAGKLKSLVELRLIANEEIEVE